MKNTTLACISLGILSACAAQPESIPATYVSPNMFAGYSCNQIISERNLVVAKVNELTGTQEKSANNDAVAMGVGLVLFWPALFFIPAGADVEGQLASAKGNYDALTAAGISKSCF